MKKIFLSCLMCLMGIISIMAEETTVWEGSQPISWNTDYFQGIQLDTYNDEALKTIFTGIAKDDIIRLYVTPGTTDPQYAFRYKAGDDWAWTDLAMTVDDGVATYTVESDEMATWIAERGIVITGQDYTLTKITLETPGSDTPEPQPGDDPFTPGENETVLNVAEGSSPLPLTLIDDWSAYTTFAATEFANAKAGDIITVYVSDVAEGAQISLKDMSDGWPALDATTEYPSVETTATTFTYTLTEESVAKVKANGLVIGGHGMTVQHVTLTTVGGDTPDPEPEPEPVVYPITLWEGSQVIDWSSNPSTWQTITRDKFENVKAGDILRFAYTDVKGGAMMALQYSVPGNWAMVPGTDFMSVDGLAKRITLTQEMLDAINSGDLHVTGVGFTLTLAEVLDASAVKTLACNVPVTGDDWIWDNGETPTFTVNITNNNADEVTANATLMLTTDKMVSITNIEQSKAIAAGSSDAIEFSLTDVTLTPSFYRATIIVNDETVRAFNFGYAPTEISSPADKQADFDSFWQTAKDELAAIEATDEPVLTKIESHSTENRTVYLVEFKSVSDGDGNPVTVRGYYAEPNDGKKHPVIMHYQGYDSGYRPGGQGVEPWCLNGDGDALSSNYAEFILSTRGQSVNNRPAAERADGIDRDFTNEYGDWFAFNFGDKDKYYYRGAYMDCVRAIDFMATRETSDMTNLYAEGQSQGGAFTYAAAALSGREFKAIAPGIAFMGDFPDYFQLTNWPAEVAFANQGSMTDEEMYAFLSYFDTKNLATLISNSTAVIATIGVQDNVCPPHTNIAPYNNLAEGTVKEISFNPENAHQVAGNWYNSYMNYFASKYVEPQVEPEPEPEVPAFSLDGFVADEGNSYDATTYTLTVNNAWSGGQLWIGEHSTYSGSKLLVKTTEDCKLKIFVGYVGGGDVDMMDEEPTKKHYLTLDNTKMIEKVIIQNQEATTITFESMELDPEEEVEPEPEPEVVDPLEDGETRVIFEDESGAVLAWNEICQKEAEWGAILEAGEQFYVTVTSRTEGCEWPKVILRDATSAEVAAVELNEVTDFPYIVKIILTDDMVGKLRNGFRFSGDGVTVTKIELYKPAPVKEGDISIEALNWFRTAVYDEATHTATTTARWGQAGWQVGDDRYIDKTLVIVNIEPAAFPVTLKMEYKNTDDATLATSVGVAAGATQINLSLPLDTKIINKVYLTYSEAGSVVLTDASVIAAANARPLTGYSDTTRINTVEGYVNDPVDVYYNLNGQRVETPTKGIYITNGKKVVVK